MEMTVHSYKDQPVYREIDQCPPQKKMLSIPRPSASLGTLAHNKALGVNLYSSVEAIDTLPCVYSTQLSQRQLQTSCTTVIQPSNLSSSVN